MGGVDKSPISVNWKESGQQCTLVIERENLEPEGLALKSFSATYSCIILGKLLNSVPLCPYLYNQENNEYY